MKKFTILMYAFFVLGISNSFATHIIGGNISYDYLGNGKFHFTMHLYRDCYLGVPPFDGESGAKYAGIGVFKETNGSFVQVNDLQLPLSKKHVVAAPVYQGLVVPTTSCVEEGTYEFDYQITDFPSASAYHFVYQRCCRNKVVINLNKPEETGFTCEAIITTKAQALSNNSAIFKSNPPKLVCANTPISLDFSATDKDSDSLYYHFSASVSGASSDTPIPDVPSIPPYEAVSYKTNFSSNNPLGNNSISLNSKTGILTGLVTSLGQYAVGIAVEEYKNGQLVNTNYRDVLLNFVACSLLSDDDINNNSLTVFPNPFNAELNISYKENYDLLTISDIYGSVLLNLQAIDNQVIDTHFFPKGVYFLTLKKGEQQVVKKIIKQ